VLPELVPPELVLPELAPLEPVAALPAPAEPLEPLPAEPPELALPELAPVEPLEPPAPLKEAVAPELTPDEAPLTEDPLGSPAHAQTRQPAAAGHAKRTTLRVPSRAIRLKDCGFNR
jgi:hypothetical protein